MKPILFAPAIALSLAVSSAAFCEPSAISTSNQSESSYKPKIFSRVSLSSSRAGRKTDFRSLRTMSGDDSGSMSEKTNFPNLNFASAIAMVSPVRDHQAAFAILQNMDAKEKRMVPTPMGKAMSLPGRIAVLRYKYDLSPSYSLTAMGGHVDTLGYLDPSLGFGYGFLDAKSRMYKLSLNLTAPATANSKMNRLVTKSTLRASVVARKDEWTTTGFLSHSRPFYEAGANLTGAAPQATVDRISPLPTLQDVDIVVLQKEKNRSTAAATAAYTKKSLTFSTAASASHFRTFRQKNIWSTSLKALGITYTSKAKWELGSSFNLNSPIEKYRSPSLPSEWSVNAFLAYSFGAMPGV